ncbi:S1C family serine protease [Novipirellula caenicola]|uniref:PDZ domain-containing protein n=1 Tax=Novipirellula caenicola TaxID=1536901 RepID=A0ABP9VWB3_9BACT
MNSTVALTTPPSNVTPFGVKGLAVFLILLCLAPAVPSVQAQVAVPPSTTINGVAGSGIGSGVGSGVSTGTLVSVPNSLQGLLRRGGTPASLEQMRLLEQQQQQVSKLARDCTVSVQIGAAQGCGVIITDTGYILTAAHVAMRPNKSAVIRMSNGRTVMATTLGMNRSVDAGLIKINDGQNEGQPWPHATLGTSDKLVPGMWCIATGHPGGYDRERGPVTRVGRILTVRPDAIVTDCALIGGDSGGPLFDIEGRLIAVHSRIGNDVADNLHIPVDHYDISWKRLAASEAWGVLPGFRPVLGVSGNQSESVARVREVRKGSPAEDAGLMVDDIVERFGDVKVTDFGSLIKAVADTMPGERVEVWVNRSNQRVRVVVEIGRED